MQTGTCLQSWTKCKHIQLKTPSLLLHSCLSIITIDKNRISHLLHTFLLYSVVLYLPWEAIWNSSPPTTLSMLLPMQLSQRWCTNKSHIKMIQTHLNKFTPDIVYMCLNCIETFKLFDHFQYSLDMFFC